MLWNDGILAALQRHCTEISKQILPEMKKLGLVPNCYIHVSVSDLYIPRDRSAYFAAEKYVDLSWKYVNRTQTHECGKLGTRPRSFIFRNT
jgi:hypothetical protein